MEKSGQPELKQVLGAIIFGAHRPVGLKEMQRCLREVAEQDGEGAPFAGVKESDMFLALEQLRTELESRSSGFTLTEIAGGFRLESDVSCGKWLRHFLDIGKPNRLSRPALETLAIIAYRQPVTRADIETVRGVNVDHIIKILLEMQLIRIVGRSEIPGKPFMYGTTHIFLEHFGLKNLEELGGIEPALWKLKDVLPKKKKESAGMGPESAGTLPSGDDGQTAEETHNEDEPENDEEKDEFDDDDEFDDEEDEDDEEETDAEISRES